MKVYEVKNEKEKLNISRKVLDDLKDWFGIDKYREDYIKQSSNMPFFVITKKTEPIGFIALKKTSDVAVEIYVVGILKKYHNQGFGKILYSHAEKHCVDNNYKLIQVKTVKSGLYKEYDLTNKFYKSNGFMELEVFEDLWDKHNPCQVFVKAI